MKHQQIILSFEDVNIFDGGWIKVEEVVQVCSHPKANIIKKPFSKFIQPATAFYFVNYKSPSLLQTSGKPKIISTKKNVLNKLSFFFREIPGQSIKFRKQAKKNPSAATMDRYWKRLIFMYAREKFSIVPAVVHMNLLN
jgi:hypothetical protein